MALVKRTTSQQCRLLELPAELLNLIYEEVLVHRSILEIYPSGDPVECIDEWEKTDRSWAHFRPSEPSLTRTCHEIRNATLPIFYGLNIFRDTTYDRCCTRFLKWLTPRKRMMLKTIRIGHYSRMVFKGDRTLTGICVIQGQAKLERMKLWLAENGIQVPEGVIHVPVRLHGDQAGEWTKDPKGHCELEGCCDNEPRVIGRVAGKIMAPEDFD